ncbi:MAG: hypothetical protein AB1451_06000 [Nitrospirota bacterium]
MNDQTISRNSIPSMFRSIAMLIFSLGVFMHAGSLVVGREPFAHGVMVPALDVAFGVLVAVGAILGLLAWRRYTGGRALRWVYGFAMFMLLISVPIHLKTLFTWNTDYLLAFPLWYSAIEVPMFVGLVYAMGRLQFDHRDG